MSNMDAYLCGPPIMIETACDALYKGGVKGTNILLTTNFKVEKWHVLLRLFSQTLLLLERKEE